MLEVHLESARLKGRGVVSVLVENFLPPSFATSIFQKLLMVSMSWSSFNAHLEEKKSLLSVVPERSPGVIAMDRLAEFCGFDGGKS